MVQISSVKARAFLNEGVDADVGKLGFCDSGTQVVSLMQSRGIQEMRRILIATWHSTVSRRVSCRIRREECHTLIHNFVQSPPE